MICKARFLGLVILLFTNQGYGTRCHEGVEAFKNSLYPFIREHCANCHGDTSRYVRFAGSRPTEAYARVIPMLNFRDIEQSYFVKRGGSMVPAVSEQDLTQQINAWWEKGQKNCAPLGNLFTLSIELPNPLPNTHEGYVLLLWPLAHLGPLFDGVFFEIEVQKFSRTERNALGFYRFRKPRLVTTKRSLRIKNVRVLINGVSDPLATAYSGIDQVVNPLPIGGDFAPHPVLSAKFQILPQVLPSGDQVAVSFDTLEENTPQTCHSVKDFEEKVMPTLKVRNCFTCHSGENQIGTEPARSRWNMNGSSSELCTSFLQRVDFRNPEDSAVIGYPHRRVHSHPWSLPFADEIFPYWTEWMESEGSHK